MSRRGIVTHAYRVPDGWERLRRRRLTGEYVAELRDQGYAMIRIRHGFFRVSEAALSWYNSSS
ncbi:alternative tryptophan synthase beta-subunit [Microbacterium sp.]|uniref:alternative tryptophan synthase beta-subunit n=1 Tax=Microbacterium sp. TaxID=51671 RepID=UPI0025D7237E|nr:alternative tryptophan synthase beta-subunit [Microbacterium sp.]MBT9605806.1 alternative tryptophan synthase beta-subunit [Microbacterium sp.]